MFRFIAQRLLTAIPVLFVVILITFTLIRLAPGGPFDQERKVPDAVLESLNKRYHLDDPVYIQFFDYLGNLIQGDFGPSFKYPTRSVTEIISTGLPVTLELGLYALLFAMILGISAGVIAAIKPNSAQDYVPMSVAMIGICMPSFVLGPLLILIFGIWFEVLPHLWRTATFADLLTNLLQVAERQAGEGKIPGRSVDAITTAFSAVGLAVAV